MKVIWQCPYCHHFLLYAPINKDVVDLAIVRHQLENHKMPIGAIIKQDRKLMAAVTELLNSSVLTYRNQFED